MRLAVVVVVTLLLALTACTPSASHEALAGYAAYDPSARGGALIDAAVARAQADHKRVLLMFGGNWCRECMALDAMFAEPVVSDALKPFVLVHVDSGTNLALNARYGDPFKLGFPALLVLDDRGAVLVTQDSGGLMLEPTAKKKVGASVTNSGDSAGYDKDRVLAFLRRYSS